MAQLPPKVPIPNMTPTWPEFSPHQKLPTLKTLLSPNASNFQNNQQNPSWVDEFLDFSSARRGVHRRSASDSVTFIETSMMEHCRRRDGDNDFERFDDEQLMSMFGVDEVSAKNMMPPPPATGALSSNSNPSTPSDHNSINDDKEEGEEEEKQQQLKHELDEDEISEGKQEIARIVNDDDDDDNDDDNNANRTTFSSQKITDPKRVKRYIQTLIMSHKFTIYMYVY
jgi:cobalamin biosynthesis protein CobT